MKKKAEHREKSHNTEFTEYRDKMQDFWEKVRILTFLSQNKNHLKMYNIVFLF